MAASGKAADSGLVNDALTAVNTSLGNKLVKPATPTTDQVVVLRSDGTTTTQASLATADTNYAAVLGQ